MGREGEVGCDRSKINKVKLFLPLFRRPGVSVPTLFLPCQVLQCPSLLHFLIFNQTPLLSHLLLRSPPPSPSPTHLYLGGMQVYRDDVIGAGYRKHVGH